MTDLKQRVFGGNHTWKNLAEELDLLLEVTVRELLMGGLHEIFTRVEEILKTEERQWHMKTNLTDHVSYHPQLSPSFFNYWKQ